MIINLDKLITFGVWSTDQWSKDGASASDSHSKWQSANDIIYTYYAIYWTN